MAYKNQKKNKKHIFEIRKDAKREKRRMKQKLLFDKVAKLFKKEKYG